MQLPAHNRMMSFAGSMEGANYLATGELISLSGQYQYLLYRHLCRLTASCLEIIPSVVKLSQLQWICLLQSSSLLTATPPRIRAAGVASWTMLLVGCIPSVVLRSSCVLLSVCFKDAPLQDLHLVNADVLMYALSCMQSTSSRMVALTQRRTTHTGLWAACATSFVKVRVCFSTSEPSRLLKSCCIHA